VNFCVDQGGVVAEWVRQRVPHVSSFGKCSALGLLDRNGSPMAGAVYHEYHPEYRTIMMSFAADTPRWATPKTIGFFLRHPFVTWGVYKVRAAVAHTNERSMKLVGGIGFTREGTLRDEFGEGVHAVMFRLLRPDFEKRYGELNEQRQQQAA